MPLSALLPLLPAAMTATMQRREQQQQLRSANIDNLESCPACDFAIIIENEEERVFRCLNPNCLKETCRYLFVAIGTPDNHLRTVTPAQTSHPHLRPSVLLRPAIPPPSALPPPLLDYRHLLPRRAGARPV